MNKKIRLVTVTGSRTNTLPHMLSHYADIVDEIYVVVYEWENFSTYDSVKEIVSLFPNAKTQCATGKYTTVTHRATKIVHETNFARSAIAPEISAGVMMANISWNVAKTSSGIG